MTQQEIDNKIKDLISRSTAGQEIEKDKIEFKSIWPNLKNEPSVSKFLKIITALATMKLKIYPLLISNF